MPTAVEDLIGSVTTGVLRALDARREGAVAKDAREQAIDLTKSGFYVNVILRCGIPAVSEELLKGIGPQQTALTSE